jgi:precorrin-8X/cobalt-precorrin-8 methylmutase
MAVVSRTVHPIETQSYRIIRSTVDTRDLPRHSRDVVERIVHTTADPSWRGDLVLDECALTAGAQALAAGAPLIVDVTMVAAGVTAYPSRCLVKDRQAAELAAATGLTRSAAAVRLAAHDLAAGDWADGAVWAIGNAPTALYELLALAAAGVVRPALIIGLPVGYVGAAESKAALRDTDLPQLSNVSARGGSAVAAAAVNALLYGDPLS